MGEADLTRHRDRKSQTAQNAQNAILPVSCLLRELRASPKSHAYQVAQSDCVARALLGLVCGKLPRSGPGVTTLGHATPQMLFCTSVLDLFGCFPIRRPAAPANRTKSSGPSALKASRNEGPIVFQGYEHPCFCGNKTSNSWQVASPVLRVDQFLPSAKSKGRDTNIEGVMANACRF